MNSRRLAAALLNSVLVLSVHAAEEADKNSPLFREWIYPDSYASEVMRMAPLPSGVPVGETGHFSSNDSIQQVVDFYAEKAGIDPAEGPVKLKLADGKPALDASIVGIRANDDAPSVMFLRNAGDNTTAVTILWWSPGDREKMVVSITRGKDDSRTLIQLLLHRRE